MAEETAKPLVEGQVPPQAPVQGVVSSDSKLVQTGFASEGVSLEETGSERPSWLPEGVDKVEDLKAYFEKTGAFAPKADDTPVDPTRAATEEGKPQSAQEAPKVRTDEEIIADLQAAGGLYADPKYQPHALIFEKTGDLTPEQRQQAATDLNVPLEYVNTFVDQSKQLRQVASSASETSKALVDNLTATARTERLEVIGGEQHFESFNKWASDPANVKPAELKAYNEAPNEATARALLSKFAEAWKQAGNGPGGRDLTQEGRQEGEGASGGVQGYASQAEMLEDMGKPQYKSDPAFRNKVAARVAASGF